MAELTLPLALDDGEDSRKKTCFVCGVPRPLSEFDKHPQMADGHVNKCKDCRKAYNRTRYADPVIGLQLRSQSAARRANGQDREARQRASKKFAKSAKGREARHRRRLDEQAAKLGYEVVNLQHVLDRDGYVCHICVALGKSAEDAEIAPRHLSFDHIIPIVRPHHGPHTLENLAPAHQRCNSWKRDRLMEELNGLEPPGVIPVDELLLRFRREAQSRSLKEFHANRDQWSDEQKTAWDERSRRLSESMQGNQNGIGSPGRTGQPWTDKERETHLVAVALMIEGGEWQAKLKIGQQARRQRERDEGLPAFSADGAARIQGGLDRMWADPERRAEMSAKRAAAKLGIKDSDETKATKSASALRAYAEGRKLPVGRKLTEESVREIRAVYVYGMARELAEKYGVSPQLIQDVAAGRRWTHVA